MPCSSVGRAYNEEMSLTPLVAGSSPATATIKPKKIQMTISEKEIRDDFERFIRHEAMRANIKQDELRRILGINN